jgi:hypothetical protein
MNLFADTTPTHVPGSGDFWNPANWSALVHEIGLPGFFALVFFGYIVWKEWRQSKQPSNREQVRILRALYMDAQTRTGRMRAIFRQLSSILVAIAKKGDVNVDAQAERIMQLLDEQPAVMPPELELDDDDDNHHHERGK